MDPTTATEVVGGGATATVGWVIWYVNSRNKILRARLDRLEQRNEQQDAATAAARERTGALVTHTHDRLNPLAKEVGSIGGRLSLVERLLRDIINKGGKGE
jgi:small-conductance mechanosensitive channel